MFPDNLRKTLIEKRLIFTISTGRSGTAYLASVLATLPDVASYHEPTPMFSDVMRAAQYDWDIATDFLVKKKLPAIARNTKPIYIETSHLFCKGFVEPLLNLDLRPDIIIHTRANRDVARSLWQLNVIPGRTTNGKVFLLAPDDPGVLQLPNWKTLHDYQLCYWYCIEIARRAKYYEQLLTGLGCRVIHSTLSEIVTWKGFGDLVSELGMDIPSSLTKRRFRTHFSGAVNQKKTHKRQNESDKTVDLDALESDVHAIIGEPNAWATTTH